MLSWWVIEKRVLEGANTNPSRNKLKDPALDAIGRESCFPYENSRKAALFRTGIAVGLALKPGGRRSRRRRFAPTPMDAEGLLTRPTPIAPGPLKKGNDLGTL